ncbi:MAG: riboflavin kinase [Sphaerochaetaceae bacterium]
MSVAFGHFDGVHRGHQAILAHNPEKIYVQPVTAQAVLTTDEERDTLIRQYVGEGCSIIHVDKRLEAKGFDSVIVGSHHPALVSLKEHNAMLDLIQPVRYKGRPITAERIATSLLSGKIEEAEEMLGHPYAMSGEVVYGRQLGRTVGMPTVNLKIAPNKLIPAHGVYGTITIVDGVRYLGVTSIGPRPTVDDYPTITIETFLLHFNRDLYGQVITMEIKTFIRPITKFESLQAVREQVDKDVLFVVEKGIA